MRCDRIVFVLVCELFLAGIIIVPCGCGSARPGDPPDDPPPQTPAVQRGQQIFVQNCNTCHPGGAAGVGPALNDKPLPESLIRSQVRNGKGIMPNFTKERISDEQLDDLVQYVVTLHKSN